MKFLKLALAAGVALSGVAHAAAPAAKSKVDAHYLPYEKPGVFAKLPNGDTIHIKCMGAGSPTVILTAGAGDWSATWRDVQPQIAAKSRVCAWDRPGFGFSSGSSHPQTVLDTTADLEAALKIAHIRGPYIAVGHSLGGYESLLFKDQNPASVVGMVLVDPSIPDQHRRLGNAAPEFIRFGDKSQSDGLSQLSSCLAGLRSGKLKLGAPDPDGCLGYPADYPPPLTKALATKDTNPLRFTAARSMLAAFNEDGSQVINPHRNYGDMPLIVLSSSKLADIPHISPGAKDQLPAFHAEWVRAHDEMAALSSRGVSRVVPDATHYIQHDQPQAVIDAVDEVVRKARSNGASAKVARRR